LAALKFYNIKTYNWQKYQNKRKLRNWHEESVVVFVVGLIKLRVLYNKFRLSFN